MGMLAALGEWIRSPMYRWKRVDDFIVEDFLSQAKDDRGHKYFNEALYVSIERRADDQMSLSRKWSTVNLVLVAVLVANIFSVHFDVSLLGLRFTDTSVAREVILFASATLGFIVGLIAVHAAILRKIALRAREESIPSWFGLANIARLDIVSTLSTVLRSYTRADRPHDSAHIFGAFVLFLVWLVGFAYVLVILGIYFYVHLLIMWDIWHGPSLSVSWSHFTVVYAFSLDLCSFALILLIQTLPLRYRNWELVAQYTQRARQSETAAALFLEDVLRKSKRKRRS